MDFKDLYSVKGLRQLDSEFACFLGDKESDLISKAIALEEFLLKKFNVSLNKQNLDAYQECKINFVQRQALKKYSSSDEYFDVLSDEEFLELSKSNYDLAMRYAAWAVTNHKESILFNLPKPLKYLDGFLEKTRDSWQISNITWQKPLNTQQAIMESKYCLFCAKRNKDSCVHGLKETLSPYGRTLKGCPLKQQISPMHEVYAKGHLLAALAIITMDNPLVAATGYRICNDCEASCIFQKQTPVNTPGVESNILAEILQLDFGFEIYSLLARWNPLSGNIWQENKNRNVLVVGLGPAGFTMAYYMLQAGYDVTAIDGTFISPLNDSKELLKRFPENYLVSGFGGVMEYGITKRWNKSLLLAIRLILERHPNFKMHSGLRLGSNLKLEDCNEFSHIALCLGAGSSKGLDIPGFNLQGVIPASAFLMQIHLENKPQIQGPVVVVGAGLTAMDAATEAKDLTNDSVDIFYHGELANIAALKINIKEVQETLLHGITLHTNKRVVEILGTTEVCAVKLNDGSIIPCQTVLIAVGANQHTAILQDEELDLRPDINPRISILGDLHPEYYGSVVQAIASAKHYAPKVDKYLSGLPEQEPHSPFQESTIIDCINQDDEYARLIIHSPMIAKHAKPGHYIKLQIPNTRNGKPFSIAKISGETIEIILNSKNLYQDFRGKILCLGPLGNAICAPVHKAYVENNLQKKVVQNFWPDITFCNNELDADIKFRKHTLLQCMMKGICGKCLRIIDGQEIYTCRLGVFDDSIKDH